VEEVADPVVLKNRVQVGQAPGDFRPPPPGGPGLKVPMLMFITVEDAPTLMLSPKPIVGPPIRTAVPGFIVMETHTSDDAALQPTAPPCVKVAVPTRVPATVMSTVDAEAAGAIARAATMTRAKIVTPRLAFRMISPSYP